MSESSSEKRAFDAERLTELGRVTAVAPSPCGTWVAVAVQRLDPDKAKYVSDLWKVPLEGVDPVRLTRGPSDDRAPCFRRDGALGFLSNRSPREGKPEEGDEDRSQVWILPAEGGEPRPLTDEPLGVSAFRFAPRGNRLVAIADVLPDVPPEKQRETLKERREKGPSMLRYREMPVRVWDAWLEPQAPHLIAYDEQGQDRRDLTPQADREHRDPDWALSPDGRWAALARASEGIDRIEDRALLLIDLESGGTRVLAEESRALFTAPVFSPDGRRIACRREIRGDDFLERQELRVLEVETGESRVLAADWDRRPLPQAWSEDGARIVVTADDQGTVPVFAVDAESGEVSRITASSAGGTHEGLSVAPGANTLVGIRHRTLHPPEPFRVELEPDSQPRLLASLSGITEEELARLASWESITAASTDGKPVQSFVVRPAREQFGDGPFPCLMWIHGGPYGQWSEGWHWRWNPLVAVARGYVVLLPNPRGSTGCGEAFIEDLWPNKWGGQCYEDLMCSSEAAASLPYVDGGRMAAMGGSFGGYMTNWIGGNTDRFRCLVTHASLYHLPAFHGTTDFPAWFAREIGCTPYERPEAYDVYSPHTRVGRWKSPTLIIHGEKDYRVPIGEGIALFEALKCHGVEAELLIFPDENHWILKPRNSVAWYAAVLEFLDKHLRA